VLLVLVVLELIRKRRLKERYALLWLVTGLVLLVLSLWRSGLNTIAGWVGIETYPPAVLFAVATLFILLVLLDYSTVISKLSEVVPGVVKSFTDKPGAQAGAGAGAAGQQPQLPPKPKTTYEKIKPYILPVALAAGGVLTVKALAGRKRGG